MTVSAIDLTRELIRYRTINPPGNEQDCIEHLGGLLEGGGFGLTYHAFGKGRANLVAHIGGNSDRKPLCFTGHVDTVPLGGQPWTVDPFQAEISNGKIYGRGASDMKSGVAAFVTAALERSDRLSSSPGLVLVITAGEETGCEGAYDLARRDGALDQAEAIVVAEPTANYPFAGHKGALWLKGQTDGVTAHGSMPEKGENAIYKAARAITKLEDFNFNVARHDVLGGPTLNVGTMQGGININSVPDQAEFGIDIRTIPSQSHARIHEELSSYLGENITLDRVVDVEGVWTDPEQSWMREVYEITANISEEKPGVKTATYFTDASVLTPAMGHPPTVILGPGEPSMAHQTDEYCYIDRIEQAVAIYKEIITRWCHQ